MHGGNLENGKYIFLRKAIITMAKVQTIYARRPWRGLHGFTGCRYGCRCIRFSRFLNSLLTPTHPFYLQPFRLYIPRNCITPSFKLILRFHLSKKDARRKKKTKKKGGNCVEWETCFGFGTKSNLPAPSGQQKKNTQVLLATMEVISTSTCSTFFWFQWKSDLKVYINAKKLNFEFVF